MSSFDEKDVTTKKDADGNETFTVNVTATSLYQGVSDKFNTLTTKYDGIKDSTIDLPEGVTAEELLESHTGHLDLQQQIADGKLSTDSDITARITKAVEDSKTSNKTLRTALETKNTALKEKVADLEMTLLKKDRASSINVAVMGMTESVPKSSMVKYLHQEIAEYMNPADPTDMTFYTGKAGERVPIISEIAEGVMQPQEFMNNYMLAKHPDFFEANKASTADPNAKVGNVDTTKLRGSALLAALAAQDRQKTA